MNRIFHARIAMGQYLFLILIGILAVYMLWYKSPFLAAIFMLWLVVIIEKLIHTTYTVTPDGKLVLSFGRFSRSKERHHFCGACFFHAGRAVCGDALCAREIWRGQVCSASSRQGGGVYPVTRGTERVSNRVCPRMRFRFNLPLSVPW